MSEAMGRVTCRELRLQRERHRSPLKIPGKVERTPATFLLTALFKCAHSPMTVSTPRAGRALPLPPTPSRSPPTPSDAPLPTSSPATPVATEAEESTTGQGRSTAH